MAAQRANISRLESQLRNETVERKAAIASAKAQLKQAQLNYDRNSNLQQQGAVTKQALYEAREALDIARAALDERKAQLNNTNQTLQQEITQEKENVELRVSMNTGIALQVFALNILMCSISGAIATRKLRTADPADIFY